MNNTINNSLQYFRVVSGNDNTDNERYGSNNGILSIETNNNVIKNVQKSLFEATLIDMGLKEAKECNNKNTIEDLEIYNEDLQKCSDDLTIIVGTRTGKPANKKDLTRVNSKKRFNVRVSAFDILANYWLSSDSTQKSAETERRSISPLKWIFEYQEEHIFDIPVRRVSPKIEVQPLDKSSKKMKPRRKIRKNGRKGSTQTKANKIIDGLSSILSELESQDETKHSDNYEDYNDFGDAYKSLNRSSKGRKSGKCTSKIRKKTSISSKIVNKNSSFLKPASRKPRTRKNRPSSISYGQVSLFKIVKSLDEISSEMESSDTRI
mmetsp:Transcript_10150/g.8950  ORF Transcript_10150/g.8950 Transcript_10150/m.8950 type:complete len:321 (+) Transcript_10150:24-986(+)